MQEESKGARYVGARRCVEHAADCPDRLHEREGLQWVSSECCAVGLLLNMQVWLTIYGLRMGTSSACLYVLM